MENDKIEVETDKLRNKITEFLEIDKLAEMVTNNTIEFTHRDVEYRATRPTHKQKQELNEKRIERFTELMSNDKYVMEDRLIEMYFKKGIDIKELDSKVRVLEKQKQDYMFKLGQAIKEGKSNTDLLTFKTEIQKITEQHQELLMKRAIYMDTSLESQVSVFVYSYLSYLCIQKKVEDKWDKAWSSYEQFMENDEALINLSVFYESFLSRVELQ